MKRKWLFSLILMFLCVLIIGGTHITVHAADEGNGDSTGEAGTDPHASVSGFSRNRSGYMFYITDASGNVVAEPYMVRYSSKPPDDVKNFLATRATGASCTQRYSGTISTVTEGGFTQPPFTVQGSAFGSALKSWLLKDDDGNGYANVLSLVGNLWGNSVRESFEVEDQYLCVEAVIWCGVKSSSNPTYIMGTSSTLNAKFNELGSNYLKNTRLCRFPHSGYLQYSWAGCYAPSVNAGSKESISDLTAQGNGFGMITPIAKKICLNLESLCL